MPSRSCSTRIRPQPVRIESYVPPLWSSDSLVSVTSSPTSPHSFGRPTTPSDVHDAVSRLLSLTKQLLEVLHLWGHRQAGEAQVSDAFVLVGSQFNTTVNAFWRHSVDMSDLFHLIVEMRATLESCLGEEPSPQTLEEYMPVVRRAVYNLLQGLRSKQGPYWAAVQRKDPLSRSRSTT